MIRAVVDSSAMFAILAREPERPVFHAAMLRLEPYMTAATKVEFGNVAAKRLGPNGLVHARELIADYGVTIVPLDDVLAEAALDAFTLLGKGRAKRPAPLNFGDLFSYSLAATRNLPILYKGKDFERAGIPSALDLLANAAETGDER